jgi:pSer/pThr/pTyr-binding forkhead associated (FHA) protein
MAKLQLSLDGGLLGEYSLDKERVTIGRRPDNDIHIDNLAVSGQHTLIVTIGNDSFIEDLSSTNGTYVNKKSIKKHVLQHDDVIELGKYTLKYINENQEKISNRNLGFENTVVMRPHQLIVSSAEEEQEEFQELVQEQADFNEQTIEVQTANLSAIINTSVNSPLIANSHDAIKEEETLQADVKEEAKEDTKQDTEEGIKEDECAQKLGHLEVINGDKTGEVLILSKIITTIGKSGAQIAVITKRPHGYFIAHVEGEAMPHVNAQPIGMKALELNNRDTVEIDGIKMEFYLA